MKILIPMAGEGSRFAKEGYTFPKPLIDVKGKPMIQTVVENLDFDCEYIFLVREEHIEKYSGLLDTLDRITNGNFKYVVVDRLTEGAACTALLAEEFIDSDEDLLIANSDQIVEYESKNFTLLKNLSTQWSLPLMRSTLSGLLSAPTLEGILQKSQRRNQSQTLLRVESIGIAEGQTLLSMPNRWSTIIFG